jgi:HEAT repeat protein
MIMNDLRNDPRRTDELFAMSLQGDYDDDAPWDAIAALRLRGTLEVFELAKKYAKSEIPKERARALDVLAQLGAGKPDIERPYKEESIAIAIRYSQDPQPLVVHQAVWALAHLGSDEAVTKLINFKKHSDPDIRNAVAFGLAGVAGRDATKTLIELMEDEDDEVRDWATFSLGQGFPPVDTPEIRTALRKRLDDSFADARAEAIWGLAIRKDPQGLKLLLDRLDGDNWTQGDEIAAEETLDLHDNSHIEQLRVGVRKLLAAAE